MSPWDFIDETVLACNSIMIFVLVWVFPLLSKAARIA